MVWRGGIVRSLGGLLPLVLAYLASISSGDSLGFGWRRPSVSSATSCLFISFYRRLGGPPIIVGRVMLTRVRIGWWSEPVPISSLTWYLTTLALIL
jgi:hypothetical protein